MVKPKRRPTVHIALAVYRGGNLVALEREWGCVRLLDKKERLFWVEVIPRSEVPARFRDQLDLSKQLRECREELRRLKKEVGNGGEHG